MEHSNFLTLPSIEILESGRADGHIRGRVNGIEVAGTAIGPKANDLAWIRSMLLNQYEQFIDKDKSNIDKDKRDE